MDSGFGMKRFLVMAILFVLLWPAAVRAQIVSYYHLDAVGNVLAVTDTAGVVIEQHDYLPFGDEWNPTPGDQPKRFTGKERDPETGLDYFGARYYGSKIGRFTTVDPVYTWRENLVDPQRWNRYAYARNNPLRYVDPDGKVAVPAILWGLAEFGLTAYDVRDAYVTYRDPDASTLAKGIAIAGTAIGVATIGGGYGKAGKEALEQLGKVSDDAGALLFRNQTARYRGQLTEETLDAARREAAGEVVARKARGDPYDHVTKVRNAQRGLVKRIDDIKNRLGVPDLGSTERTALTKELGDASRLLDRSEQFLPRQ
jgi:RHS repeat-associated protein